MNTTFETPHEREMATLGGGCFWCLDAVYRQVRGVTAVVSGYAGGHAPRPTYEQVCAGRTGHAEVVQVTFDPAQINYQDVLGIFFSIHDPTTKDRQGADVGTQYRSIILYHSDAQRAAAEAMTAELTRERIWNDPIVTQVEPLGEFHPAEPYHQDYFARNPGQGYCNVVIAPKVAAFRRRYAQLLSA